MDSEPRRPPEPRRLRGAVFPHELTDPVSKSMAKRRAERRRTKLGGAAARFSGLGFANRPALVGPVERARRSAGSRFTGLFP